MSYRPDQPKQLDQTDQLNGSTSVEKISDVERATTRVLASASISDSEARFVRRLVSLLGASRNTDASKPNRAALAALRRGSGKRPGTVIDMFPYVIPYCGHLPESRQNDFFLVASLFAIHHGTIPPTVSGPDRRLTNLGVSFRILSSKMEGARIEQRFVTLLDASRDGLDEHLRHTISLLRAHNVGVDWLQLLRDLRWWSSPAHYVQRRWAKAYWQPDSREGRSLPGGSELSDPFTSDLSESVDSAISGESE